MKLIKITIFSGDGCSTRDDGDHYILRIDSPFSQCGTVTQHSGDDYQYTNTVVYNQQREVRVEGDVPVITSINIIEFTCNYEDKYSLHLDGPITPAVATVDAKTGFGDFTVNLGLFKDQTFTSPYPTDPVVQISNEVCVQLELTVRTLKFLFIFKKVLKKLRKKSTTRCANKIGAHFWLSKFPISNRQ
jgi:hypothetical protein